MSRVNHNTSLMGRILFLGAILLMIGLPAHAMQDSVLKGHDISQALDVESDDIRLKQKKGQAFLSGSVKVTQGDLKLSADKIVIFYDIAKGFDNPSVQRLDATGGVTLVSPSETVSSEWGVYDVENRIVTLGGNVSFKSAEAAIKGDRLELNLITGLVTLDGTATGEAGRVKGRFSVPKAKEN